MADRSKLPLPVPTPETQHFWDGTRDGKLLLQKCDDCGSVYFPPRPFCPSCQSKSECCWTACWAVRVSLAACVGAAPPDQTAPQARERQH